MGNKIALIDTTEATITSCIGIYFQLINNFDGNVSENWRTQVRESAYRYMKEHDLDEESPLEITMPCGETATFEKFDDIPMEDVRCTCGNPNHWFIKYRAYVKEGK